MMTPETRAAGNRAIERRRAADLALRIDRMVMAHLRVNGFEKTVKYLGLEHATVASFERVRQRVVGNDES